MRLCFFAFAFVLACQPEEAHPPNIGDFDGSLPPSPGSNNNGIPDGGDASFGDGGVSIASASSPANLIIVGQSLYYTNHGDGTISVVPTSGGTRTNVATGLDGPWGIALGGGTVYFTLVRASGTGGVFSVPAGGGTVTMIEDNVTGTNGMTADSANVYWTLDGSSSGNGAVAVQALPFGSTTFKQLLDNGNSFTPDALVLAGTDLFLPGGGFTAQAAVYWGSTTGTPNLEPLDTPQPTNYADVAVSDTTVYATIDDVAPNGAIVSFARGGGVQTNVAVGLNHPQRLALDGSRLYFTDPAGGNVWVKDLSTSDAPVVFASGLSAPLPIAVTDAVYVGTTDAIVRLPKL